MIKTTYKLFKPSTSPTKKPIINIFEIFYHTILPCILTYLIIHLKLPALFIFLLIPILIRFKPKNS